MRLAGPPEKVFPLLCPVREFEWIESWACEMVFSRSGVAELDCVFQTDFADDGPQDTWVISRYEPPERLEFVRINAVRAMRYAITLSREGDSHTRAEWKQVLTGLNVEGEKVLKALTPEVYAEEMEMLERMLNHFLATGERLAV
jgi:hypothetical protein